MRVRGVVVVAVVVAVWLSNIMVFAASERCAGRFELDKLNAQLNKASKEVGMKKKNKEDASEEMAKVAEVKQNIEA